MSCTKILEVHSDTGFRREGNEEGEVDGKTIKGVNIIRLGQQLSEANGLLTFICHLIDWIIGAIKVVVRSTFTSETHGVITGADHSICIAPTFHEITCGPVSLTVARNLTEYSGLNFSIHCVTDARNLLLILRNVNMKIPAGKNFIVHLLWPKNKLENGVAKKLIWTDTRDMTADGHTQGSIKRTAIHALMNGSMSIQHKREELILYNPRAKLTQAPEVLHAFLAFPVNLALTNSPLPPVSTLKNSPLSR